MREIVVFTRIVHRLGLDLSRRSTARRRRSAIAFDSPKTIFVLGICEIERARRRWSRSPRTASIWLPTDCRSLPYYIPDVVETNGRYRPSKLRFYQPWQTRTERLLASGMQLPERIATDDHIDLAWDVIRGVC
ncbi:uncharacterized protein LOC120897748 isoform X2 [Anopheles arabiensis]|uniref:uncharacterized protein LOC120897748 isoform X2 n=1 Tax=Anopheles arabiensis TaxID=7173 RepID=UPI001AAD60B1|nr:uncharacterized protein LOC120897748 isoform X2 [Anopheles arabiensis]